MRKAMGDAAVAAARAIAYRGAGTIEFIAGADRKFYFMEMNTRLQVEHPVTEMTTGEDLVEWQLRVAAGEALPLRQAEITSGGHAIEVRLCAENPANDFLPETGRIGVLRAPHEIDEIVRLDTGVREGDEVSVFYDPMIAKLVVWGSDRPEAARRMHEALGETEILGVKTNLAFLERVVAHPAFLAGDTDTRPSIPSATRPTSFPRAWKSRSKRSWLPPRAPSSTNATPSPRGPPRPGTTSTAGA